MKINRSVKCSLKHLTLDKKSRLNNIRKEYSNIVNKYISLIEKEPENKTKYDLGCKNFTNKVESWFSARMKQVAFQEAYGMVLGARNLSKSTGKLYISPFHYGKRVMLTSNIISIEDSKNIKNFDMVVKLTSIGNKERIFLPVKKHRQYNKWNSFGKRASTIILTENYIQFSFCINTDKKKKLEEGEFVGIDSGVKSLMSLSTGEFIGEKIESLINKLHNKKQNSKAYKRCKKEISYYINEQVKRLPFSHTSLFVVENLRDIKQKMKVRRRLTKNIRRVIHNWNYRQLLDRIKMSCEENRVSFRSVSPFYTSITCSQCGHVDKTNRLSQEIFKCQECDHTDNADHNASLNILNRFVTGKYGPCYQTI